MEPGDRIADRFEVDALAGEGGMGRVFRARDLASGAWVALKILRSSEPRFAARFEREAALLACIEHEGVVGYVAHGRTPGGEPWLAMRWVEGESLERRLERDRLTVEDTLELGVGIARALAAMHEAGVVHRDVKPSNVLLEDGGFGRVVLIDLGVARDRLAGATLTRTGDVVGTPAYMPPEQVRGERLDARADVYALGCVLYRALTGRCPFEGPTPLATMAKILLEPLPEVAEHRAGVPDRLIAALTAMLSKDPQPRPVDGAAAAALLAGIDATSARPSERPGPRRTLGPSEQQLVSILMCGDPSAPADETETAAEAALADRTARLRAAVAAHEGTLALLRDEAFVVAFTGPGASADRAVRAAHCALELRGLSPSAPLSLVTGRAVVEGASPVGEVIDRAVRQLATAPTGRAAVLVDELTARLIEGRLEVRDGVLVGPRAGVGEVRTLLGRPTPFVGREWETTTLLGLYDECVDERSARAAVVLGAAGAGKSRLASELVAALQDREAPPLLLCGRGDPIAMASPFGLLAEAVRGSARVVDGEPPARQRQALLSWLEPALGRDREALLRVAGFVGEMVGVQLDDDGGRLSSARLDARVMGASIREAWEDLLRAFTEQRPVVLLLDDLQWAGPPTVSLVDAALRHLADRPLLVVALARPEVDDAFPGLWAERHAQRLRLRPLSRKASRRLVEAAMGEAVEPETLERVVARAEGNAFYLEEHVRALAAGQDVLPESLLSMVQARLRALDDEQRRALRAASVFGETFWPGGVRALTEIGHGLSALLSTLEERELVVRRPTSSLDGEIELSFRNALVREAAYATLTDADRELGHALAGRWLDGAGVHDPAVLASHYDRGRVPDRASACYLAAARQALRGYDHAGVLDRVARALELAPAEDDVGVLLSLRCEAHHVRAEYAEAEAAGRRAVERLPDGSAAWLSTTRLLLAAAASRGEAARVAEVADELVRVEAGDDEARAAQIIGLAEAAGQLELVGRSARAGELLELARAMLGPAPAPAARAWVSWITSHRALSAGDPSGALAGMLDAVEGFDRAGDARYACSVRIGVGYALAELGRHARAEAELRHALAAAERLDLPRTVCAALDNLGFALVQRGAHEEGRDVLLRAVQSAIDVGNPRYEGLSRAYLALAQLGLGAPADAERQARLAGEILRDEAPPLAMSQAVLALALLARGRASEAVVSARSARATLDAVGGGVSEGLIRLAYAEALLAVGDPAAAAAARDAVERLETRAAAIEDPSDREAFLTAVPENARTLALPR